MNILKRLLGRRSEATANDKQAHRGRLLPPPRDVGQMDIGNGLTLDVDYDDQQTVYRFRVFRSGDFDKVVKEFRLQLGRFRGSSGSNVVLPIAIELPTEPPVQQPLRSSPLEFDPTAYTRAIEEVKRTFAAIQAANLKGIE
jgi:hypothetical protein